MAESDRVAIVLVAGTDPSTAAALGTDEATPPVTLVLDTLGGAGWPVVLSCDRALAAACRAIAGETRIRSTEEASPAARLGATLDAVDAPTVAVVDGAMAGVDPTFLSFLADRKASTDGAVPLRQDGTPEPAHAVYDADALREAAASAVATGRGDLESMLASMTVTRVPPAEVVQITDWATLDRSPQPE